MSNSYHAQPYDISKKGFYFTDMASYEAGVAASGAEEFELQFIDGDDAELFTACRVDQANLDTWFDEVEGLDDYEKVALFYLMDNHGWRMDSALQSYQDVSISEQTLLDAASELFDECYLPEVPEAVRNYIDYEAFARDCRLGGDLVEFEYMGTTYTCTNASCL